MICVILGQSVDGLTFQLFQRIWDASCSNFDKELRTAVVQRAYLRLNGSDLLADRNACLGTAT